MRSPAAPSTLPCARVPKNGPGATISATISAIKPAGAKPAVTTEAGGAESECLVLIALCEVLIPFGAILTRFSEIMTTFGELTTAIGLVHHPAPDISVREIIAGFRELLPRFCEVPPPLVGLLPRLAEVVPRFAELGGGSVIAHSVHVDSPLSRGCPRLPRADALGSLPAFLPARRNKFCAVCHSALLTTLASHFPNCRAGAGDALAGAQLVDEILPDVSADYDKLAESDEIA